MVWYIFLQCTSLFPKSSTAFRPPVTVSPLSAPWTMVDASMACASGEPKWPPQLDIWGGVLGGTIAPEKAALTLFKHGVVIVPGARRARLDRRGAAREGLAAAASSAAGGNTSAIAELLAVAQLWAADGGCPEARVRPRRGPALEKFTIAFPGTRLSG